MLAFSFVRSHVDGGPLSLWQHRRQAVRETIWQGGVPPANAVPTLTHTNVTGMQQLLWNITSKALSVPSVVYHLPATPGKLQQACAVLYHTGHDWHLCRSTTCGRQRDCSLQGCRWWDNSDVTDFIHGELGCDAYFLYMPLRGPNHELQPGKGYLHQYFERWQRRGEWTLRFFIEPTYLTVSHALAAGYTAVYVMGLSGGAWTSTVAAAIDPRITGSLLIAGSLPWSIPRHNPGDFEQRHRKGDSRWYLSAAQNFSSLYTLAAMGPGRFSLQLLHENDPCCFHARGRHAAIAAYNAWVGKQLRLTVTPQQTGSHDPHTMFGSFATVVTPGKVHAITEADRAVASLVFRHGSAQLHPRDVAAINASVKLM